MASETSVSGNKETFSIGLVQTACVADREHNLATAFDGVRQAASRGAQIVCLQELFTSEYFCQREDSALFDLAEPVPGRSTTAASALAKELSIALVVPIFERRAPGLFHNSAVVFDATGERLGMYRKMHIPDDPHFYEKFYFTPGDLGFQVFETRFARIGVLICWDQWYPEAARLTALRGAEVVFYPTAIGWLAADKNNPDEGLAQLDAWQTIQRSHAIANGVYVAAANRVGHEGPAAAGVDFWGRSFVCDPLGRVMVEASATAGDVLIATCGRTVLENQRRAWPFLRDRRIDSYAGIDRRFLDTPSP